MRKHGPYILLCVALVGAAIALGYFMMQVDTLEPNGTWRDVDKDYYIVFRSTGQYVESTYNVERPYEVVDGGVYLYDAAGEPYYVALRPSIGGVATLHLNGEDHKMRRATSLEAANPLLYQWGTELKGKCTAAYTLKQPLGKEYYLRLYDDQVFTSILGDETTVGKYAKTARGDILLLTEQGTRVDQLKQWANGAVFGAIEGNMQAEVQKANMVDDLGYLFSGSCRDDNTNTTYRFDKTGTCYRVQANGTATEFLYFADMTGLITMTDSAGSGVMDYLWYDAENQVVYRYVLGTDDWYTYLSGGGGSSGVFGQEPTMELDEPQEPEIVPLIPEDASTLEQGKEGLP